MVQRKDMLSYSERRAMSPEQWKANHARDDARKLVNPPPSLAGFLPDKPPPPRLVSSNDGKQAAHNAHAPLTYTLGDTVGDKLRELPVGSVVKVNPAMPQSQPPPPPSSEPPAPANQNETEPQSKRRYTKRVVLEAHERREAVIDSLRVGLEKAGEKWNVDHNSIYAWRRAARLVAEGYAPDKCAQILGVNTPGSTKESAQTIFTQALHGLGAPPSEAPTLPASAPEPPKSALDELLAAHVLEPDPPTEADKLRDQLTERDATLAGYKIELEKLRSELATQGAELKTVREHNAALIRTLEAAATRRGR